MESPARRKFLKAGATATAYGLVAPVTYLLSVPQADAWVLPALRIIPAIIRASRARKLLKNAGRIARSSQAARYGGAAAAAGVASRSNAASWLGGASELYFLADMFSWVNSSVVEEMRQYNAEELWINYAEDYDLHNVISVEVQSFSNEVYSDNLIVTATDVHSHLNEVIWGSVASAHPNQRSMFHGEVNSFESNGIKRIRAKFMNDGGKYGFDEKTVMVTDYSNVRLKRG